MEKWQKAKNYIGKEYFDYYVSLGQSRDSNILDRSNFDNALEELGGETDTVVIVRDKHWAVGWIEWIAIHETDNKAISIGVDIEKRLVDYPVLNEKEYSDREHDAIIDTWLNTYSLQDRINLCKKYEESIFFFRAFFCFISFPEKY